jgi:phospholipid/cholesterol/gamma-HCH transport system permease protein
MQQVDLQTGSARLGLGQSGPETLLIELAGAWLLESGTPTFDSIETVLVREPGLKRAAYDTSGLGDWDSAAISFLVQTSQRLRTRGIVEDRSGLPPGLQRLVALAQAVPERSGARAAEKREPLLARIGAAGIELAGGVEEYLSFIGQCGVAFANLLRGRARYRREDFLIVLEACGAKALGIVALISFMVGAILAFMGAVQLQQFGASIYVADLVAMGMARARWAR